MLDRLNGALVFAEAGDPPVAATVEALHDVGCRRRSSGYRYTTVADERETAAGPSNARRTRACRSHNPSDTRLT